MARRPQAWEQELKFVHVYQSSENKDNYSVSPNRSMKPQKVATQELDIPSTFGVTWSPLAPLVELWAMLRILGIVPYVFDKTLNLYVLRWRSVAAMLTITIATYFSIATVTGTVGIILSLSSQPMFHSTEQEVKFIWQMMVVVLFGSMLLNAWSQTVSLLLAGNRLCRLLNSWLYMAHLSDVSPTKGVKIRVRLQMAFVIGSSVSILSLVLAGFPNVMLEGLDGVASILFLMPTAWLELSPFITQVTSLLHIYVCTRLSLMLTSLLYWLKCFYMSIKPTF